MSETPPPTTPDVLPTDSFSDIEAMQASAARRLVEAPLTTQEVPQPAEKSKPNKLKVVGSVAALATTAAVGIGAVANADAAPDFSEETKTITVEQNEDLWGVAQEVIGSDSVDMRDVVDHISARPDNIEALKDGLQPGESIVIPVSIEGTEEQQ